MRTLRTLIVLPALVMMVHTADAQIQIDPDDYGPIANWPFATGGHTGDRAARISGGREGEGRSAITLPEPVTGNARFEIWFYTGNEPDFGDVQAIGGNVGGHVPHMYKCPRSCGTNTLICTPLSDESEP